VHAPGRTLQAPATKAPTDRTDLGQLNAGSRRLPRRLKRGCTLHGAAASHRLREENFSRVRRVLRDRNLGLIVCRVCSLRCSAWAKG